MNSSLLRSIDDLRGPAGRIEALLNEGEDDAPYAALVCHPHPLFGGTMHNKVVYHAMKTFQGYGLPVLRFNFRGAGLSEGTHDNGHGESGRCSRCARLAGAGIPPAYSLRRLLFWLKRGFARLLRRQTGQRNRSPGASGPCRGAGLSLPFSRRMQPAQAVYQRNRG